MLSKTHIPNGVHNSQFKLNRLENRRRIDLSKRIRNVNTRSNCMSSHEIIELVLELLRRMLTLSSRMYAYFSSPHNLCRSKSHTKFVLFVDLRLESPFTVYREHPCPFAVHKADCIWLRRSGQMHLLREPLGFVYAIRCDRLQIEFELWVCLCAVRVYNLSS